MREERECEILGIICFYLLHPRVGYGLIFSRRSFRALFVGWTGLEVIWKKITAVETCNVRDFIGQISLSKLRSPSIKTSALV